MFACVCAYVCVRAHVCIFTYECAYACMFVCWAHMLASIHANSKGKQHGGAHQRDLAVLKPHLDVIAVLVDALYSRGA